MSDSSITVDGTIHVVYNEGLSEGVGAHGQCFDGLWVDEIMGGATVK